MMLHYQCQALRPWKNVWFYCGQWNTHTHKEIEREKALPNAVILSLKVDVNTVDQVAEEPSINSFRKLVSVLLWHLYSVTSRDHITWKEKKRLWLFWALEIRIRFALLYCVYGWKRSNILQMTVASCLPVRMLKFWIKMWKNKLQLKAELFNCNKLRR